MKRVPVFQAYFPVFCPESRPSPPTSSPAPFKICIICDSFICVMALLWVGGWGRVWIFGDILLWPSL